MKNLILNDLTKPGLAPVHLVLDDTVISAYVESVVGNIYWRFEDEPTAEPQFLGRAIAGRSLRVPFDMSKGRAIRLFNVAETANNLFSAVNVKDAVQIVFDPNVETSVPVIYPLTNATNTNVTIGVNNFTTLAKFRKIVVSPNSDMSSPDSTVVQAASEFGQNLLPPSVLITKTGISGTDTKYVRVSHSSNGTTYGTGSNILTVVFADSGGSGGTPLDPSGSCFTGDTLIKMFDDKTYGFAEIFSRKDYFIGKFALSFDENNNPVLGEIEEVFRHTVTEYLEVSFSDGSKICVTAEHPFFTEKFEYTAIGKLKAGDKVFNEKMQGVKILEIIPQMAKEGIYVYNARIKKYQNYVAGGKRVHNLKDVNL